MAIRFRIRKLFALVTVGAFACWEPSCWIRLGVVRIFAELWFFYVGVAALTAAPLFFVTRKRVEWCWWELLVLFLPFIVWRHLMFSGFAGGKSLANLGSEPIYIALFVPVTASLRVVLSRYIPVRACACTFVLTMLIAAVAVYFIMPPLSE